MYIHPQIKWCWGMVLRWAAYLGLCLSLLFPLVAVDSELPLPVDWSQLTFRQALANSKQNDLAVRLSNDSQHLISIQYGNAFVWRLTDGTCVGEIAFLGRNPEGVALNRDGTQAYVWNSRGQGEIFDVATGKSSQIKLPGGLLMESAWVDDNRLVLVTTDANGGPWKTLQIWHVAEEKVVGNLCHVSDWTAFSSDIVALSESKKGIWSLVRMEYQTGTTTELATGLAPRIKPLTTIKPASLLQTSEDGRAGVFVDKTGTIHRWNWVDGREIEPPITTSHLRGLALDTTGTQLAVQEVPGDLRLIDFVKGTDIKRFSDRVTARQDCGTDLTVLFSPDRRAVFGGPLYEAGFGLYFQAWDPSNGQELVKISGPNGAHDPTTHLRIFPVQAGVVVAIGYALELWGPDPDPPQINRDPLMTAELGRLNLRHTLLDVVLNGSPEEVADWMENHPEELKRMEELQENEVLFAIQSGRIEILKALLDAGVKVDNPYTGYHSPLFEAGSAHNRAMMDLLWSHGARMGWRQFDLLRAVTEQPPRCGDRAWDTCVMMQVDSHPCTDQALAEWIFDHRRLHDPNVIRYVVRQLRLDKQNDATASYVYNRATFVSTEWLILLQAGLIVLYLWRYRVIRRRHRSGIAANGTPAQVVTQTVEGSADVPNANPVPVPGAGWGDDGRGTTAGLTPEQAVQLAALRLRNQRARIAPLITFFGSLVVAILPAVNWYWLGHDINNFIWLPFGALVIWALTFIPWTWLRQLNHLAGIFGGMAGFFGGFVAWGASSYEGPQDHWVSVLCVVAGISALPMAFGMARNLPVVWQLGKLKRIEKAARKGAKAAYRRNPEEDLGVKPGWDTQNASSDLKDKPPR